LSNNPQPLADTLSIRCKHGGVKSARRFSSASPLRSAGAGILMLMQLKEKGEKGKKPSCRPSGGTHLAFPGFPVFQFAFRCHSFLP
jgi:hypothetical protein